MRRLLSLDYVLEHLHLPWLPTEPEKVAAFEALAIERQLLPQRVYRGGRKGRRSSRERLIAFPPPGRASTAARGADSRV